VPRSRTVANEELGEYLLRIHRKEMWPPIRDLVPVRCLHRVGYRSDLSQGCVLTIGPS
jgi:hypothetical protein